ncbi:indolepyruvate oxidoreductase subunit beta [Desulfoferrobacter suflitae]|uniref:indolepyruvate oxidoreductase subunit beta n=1 Tax=Desulfoferrobacter suflitae TaxID=2865782 RepID=UPI00216412EF|nr:indolepyruvate oxidoreductase subunit beta [Desulfoferrobacter suflitae]MCK8604100.1 indolepyruvate oxidoreductase subunit beta [Desulfoferrobacter suflitae]
MPLDNKAFDAIRIFFTGVGGQGTLLATRLVGEAALQQGIPVCLSEIHGMAQRGGVVESSVVVGNRASPTIADGEADILMAFEPLEAARALPKCRKETVLITSTVPIVPFTVAVGQSTYPDLAQLYALLEGSVARLIKVEAAVLASRAGSEKAANIVMTGVLAALNQLPISRQNWQEALRRTIPERFLALNKKAFELGWQFGLQV